MTKKKHQFACPIRGTLGNQKLFGILKVDVCGFVLLIKCISLNNVFRILAAVLPFLGEIVGFIAGGLLYFLKFARKPQATS